MIGWISTILSVIGIVMNAKKIIWCWPVWMASNVGFIYGAIFVDFTPNLIVLWVMFLGFNVYGWREWKKSSSTTQER